MIKHFYEEKFAKYALQYGLQPADRIIKPIFQTGISKHHVIYLGMDENGIEWISENQKFVGVRLVEAGNYFHPSKQYNVQKFMGNQNERISAVKRALEILGQPYDLILYNCEHYASYVQTGKAESQQVRTGFLLTCGIILFAALMR